VTKSAKRVEVDPGYLVCPDCRGHRKCFNCRGTGVADGQLCGYCAGGKTCVTCSGAGQIREDPQL